MKLSTVSNELKLNKLLSVDVPIRQEHGIHLRPSACFAKLTQLFPHKDIYVSKNGINKTPMKCSMLQIFYMEIKQGDTIQLQVDSKYPKCLLQTVAKVLSAKTPEESVKITDKFMQNPINKFKLKLANLFET